MNKTRLCNVDTVRCQVQDTTRKYDDASRADDIVSDACIVEQTFWGNLNQLDIIKTRKKPLVEKDFGFASPLVEKFII